MSDFSHASQRIVDDYLKHEPIAATFFGLHDYDRELPDVTIDGFAAANARAKAYLATLDRFDPEKLSMSDRIDRALLAARFETDVREHTQLASHRHNPSLYADIAVNAVYSLLMHGPEHMDERLPALDARLRGIPVVLESGQANLVRSPVIWTRIAIEEAKGGVDFLRDDIGPLAGRYPQLQEPLVRAIGAFDSFRTFLAERHISRDGVSFAIGRDLFDFKLKREHLLPYDCASLLEFGHEAMRATLAALDRTAAQIDSAKSWGELVGILRTDHPDEKNLLDEYRRGVDEARRFVIDRHLVTMPADDQLDVVETPPFMRPTVPYAAYMPPGPYEKTQRGLYYVTPIDSNLSSAERAEQLLGHNRYGMLLTNVHEAYPGHHVQLVKANETKSAVRKLLENTVLIEGWALYCEQLVLDEGMTQDPRVRLFQLKDQLWRACRVVIDVKLHTGEMTFDEAVAMLVDVAHLERPNAVGEARRYTQSPTQPMSYLTGKHQIMALRENERARLASQFDLLDFHDRLLAQGSIPISLIEPALAEKS